MGGGERDVNNTYSEDEGVEREEEIENERRGDEEEDGTVPRTARDTDSKTDSSPTDASRSRWDERRRRQCVTERRGRGQGVR